MKKHLLTILALTFFGVAGAQTTHFSQYVGSSMGANGMGSVKLATGTFVTVTNNDMSELELTRYNSSGVIQSTHKLSNPQYSFTSVASVIPAGSNALLVTGQAYSNTGVVTVFYVAKVDLSTNTMTLAYKNIESFSYTKGPKAYYSPEGSVYALFPQYNYFDIHKMDSDLNSLWAKTVECDTVTGKNPGMDCEVVDSSIIIVGKCDSLLGCGDLDTNGTFDSLKLYMINGYTRIYNITKASNGDLLIAGLYSPVYASGMDSRPLLARMKRNGSVLWARVLDPAMTNTFARFVEVQELANGKIVGFATTTEAYSDTYFDGACTFDANGNLLSSVKFGSYNWSTGTGMAYQLYDVKAYASGILMTGNITDYDNGGTIKRMMVYTDENFSEVCHKSVVTVTPSAFAMGSPTNYGTSNVREGNGYAPGLSSPMGMVATGSIPADVCAITTGVDEEDVQVNTNVYPNPVMAGDAFAVKLETPGMYTFVITDLSGKLVRTESTIGNRATISTQGLATGAYVLNVMSNNRSVAVHKLMVK